jgi:hypothetical protein
MHLQSRAPGVTGQSAVTCGFACYALPMALQITRHPFDEAGSWSVGHAH